MEALSDIPLPGEIAPDSAPEPTTTITNNEPEKPSEPEVGDSSVGAEPSEEPVATTDTDSNEVIDQKSTDDQEKPEVHESIESEQTEPMDVDTNTLNAENLNELEVPTEETSVENETPMDTSDVNKESSDVNTEKEAENIEAETTIQETIDESENEPKPDDALKQSEKETENESDVAPEEVTEKEPVVTENSIDTNDQSESSEPPKEPETEMDTDKTNTENVETEKETQKKEREQVEKSSTTNTENENTENSEKQSESTSDKNTSEAGTSMDITNEISKDTADISKDLNEDSHDDEGTEFVQVNTENEPNESEKDDSNKQDEFLEDPIGADELDHDQEPEHETETMGEGADEELCIIPDTERVISQAEKDAASSIPPLKEISATSASESTETSETAPTPEVSTKIVISKCTSEDVQTCMKCQSQKKAKYSLTKDGTDQYLCDDACLEEIKEANVGNVVLNWDGEIRVKDLGPNKEKEPIVEVVTFIRKCAACSQKISNEETNLTWEIMDFCNEMCLSKYQKEYGSRCSSCSGEVRANSLGKYCVRFGNDIRQFCTSHCLEEYKKGLKVCSYCQQDMSTGQEGFLAPVGDKGQFKDFCSQLCMEKYDIMTNDRPPKVPEGTTCSVCKADKAITIDFTLEDKSNFFCSEPCFVAFRFVNSVKAGKCAMCRRYFPSDVLEGNTMFYDNVQHSFCSNSCQNIYIIAHRKIVPCSWCKVKKYNFDMIRRYNKDGTLLNMCSVNCLSLYQVSMNAVNSKKTSCDFCLKNLQAMYHLTMSDATIRNFCSYNCVMSFQNKFAKQPITLNSNSDADTYPIPTGGPKRSKRLSKLPENASTNRLIAESPVSEMPTIPIISSVQSLANTNGTLSTTNATRQTRAKAAAAPTASPAAPIDIPVQLKQHIIVKPTPVPEQRNVMTMCRVKMANKGSNAVPKMVDASVQTDKREADKILIPVPVPIFIPVPLHMFTAPVPTPVPFPIPVPVPIFIPTTRNSANGILKEIKKIQVKIPTDPYEAELLMMAEMVAGDKKEDHTDSESDLDDTGAADDGPPAGGFSPDPQDASNTFGDDMLQMALKMATELEEPAVDLEGALTANTITAAAQANEPNNVHHEESVDDPQMLERTGQRGRKRGMRGSRSGGYPSKRGRRSTSAQQPQLDIPMMGGHQQPPPPPEPVEKPDANMCLKYTFGVNAWKQWVTFKNAELEKSSRRVKLFKTEILQLTSDELNYSLCLFVKEVRKPNGAEYAPDTIYYLCLGIQQYLFENGRIDNIFCDTYYEKFTDCLDEVARKFSVLYNDSHYIVTRVEEEHLWESKQLGAHSPHVLLSTLMFFNTKHFNLTTVDEHMQLSFSHIMKHWKRNPNQPGAAKVPGSRNVLLRFYPPQSAIQNNARKKKVYEQQENEENPLRCPVKLYEFYLSKCPESVKTRNDVFYLQPERSCVPDSPVWYSTMPLPREALEKMLHRVKMVKEINVALLTS